MLKNKRYLLIFILLILVSVSSVLGGPGGIAWGEVTPIEGCPAPYEHPEGRPICERFVVCHTSCRPIPYSPEIDLADVNSCYVGCLDEAEASWANVKDEDEFFCSSPSVGIDLPDTPGCRLFCDCGAACDAKSTDTAWNEECYRKCWHDCAKPQIQEEPEPVEQDDVIQETYEVGGSVNEWKKILIEKTGKDSEVSKGLAECDNSIQKQNEVCSKPGGWMVSNNLEVSISGSDKRYEYQDIAARSKCPQGESPKIMIETKSVTSGSGDYQVVCNIQCFTWDCKPLEVIGKVNIKKADGTLKKADDGLERGDVIKTEKGGTATINVGASSNIMVGPDSSLEVEEMGDKKSFFLKDGKSWGHIKEGSVSGGVKIRTPNVEHTVKGTEFIIEYDEGEEVSTLYLYNGTIEIVTSTGETKEIVAGEMAVVEGDGVIETSLLSDYLEIKKGFVEVGHATNDDLRTMSIVLLVMIVIFGIIGFVLKKIAKPKSNTLGVTSLVFSIIGLLTILAPFIGLPLSVSAIALSREQKKIMSSGIATAGFVIGIIGTVFNVFTLIVFLVIL